MLFSDLLRELDQLLTDAADQPSNTQVARFVELVQDSTLRQYAFQHLEEPAWLRPLLEVGFFQSPPPLIQDEARRTTSFPFWHESRYLARMASRDPASVAEIIQRIPATGNITVNEDLAEAALAMPSDLAADLLPQAKQWAESADNLTLPATLGRLVAHFAHGNQATEAVELARVLLAVLPDSRTEGEEVSQRLSPEPRARIEPYDYAQVVQECLPALVEADAVGTFHMFCDLLDEAVRLSRRRPDDEDGAEDYSYIWRPAIEETDEGSGQGLKDLLVSAVRDAGNEAVGRGEATVGDTVRSLEARRWRVFHRIALHLLRACPDGAQDLMVQRLTDPHYFSSFGLQHEYRLLLNAYFHSLDLTQRRTILGWIEQGPNVPLFVQNYQQWRGQAPSDEEQRQFADAWRRDWLACVAEALPPEWHDRYHRLVAELGRSEPLEPATRITGGFVGPTTPRTSEDLQSMSPEEVVEFFRTWQPSGRQAGLMDAPTPEGLGRTFQTLVGAHPERYAAAAGLFRDLDPTYVRSLFVGLREAANQNRPFDWSPVLELARWVLEQPYTPPPLEGTWLDCDPGWGWTRGAIADLLYSGFEQRETECPFRLRTDAFAALEPLTDDPEPTPEYEERYGGTNMDPPTLSLNTTRGKAMHAVVRYGLWVRRHVGVGNSDNVTFGHMPEVPKVLDRHLDPRTDPALAVRAVYGQWFPWLVMLDPEWAARNVSRVFPDEPESEVLRDAAWSTYLKFCPPYNAVFDLLAAEYGRAIEQISPTSDRRSPDGPDERLAEHLLTFYWRGKLDLQDDGLVARFYRTAPQPLRGHSLDFVGRSLRNTKDEVPAHIIARLVALWEWRLGTAKGSGTPHSFASELASFGWWFMCPQFEVDWLLANLHEALRLTAQLDVLERPRLDPQRDVVERLATLVRLDARRAVQCLGYLMEIDTQGWQITYWRDFALNILGAAIQGADPSAREEAIQLADRLVARGFYGFREVIPADIGQASSPS